MKQELTVCGPIKGAKSFPIAMTLGELVLLEHLLTIEIIRCEKLRTQKKMKTDQFFLSFIYDIESLRDKVKDKLGTL